jgi:hypothetical protein
MQHHFDIEIAKEYGVDVAIFLDSLSFWLRKNIANNHNFYDGRFWTYNSQRALSSLFPYWSRQNLRTILKKCFDAELIVEGVYNKNNYDQTKWYSLTDKGMALFPGLSLIGWNQPIEGLESTNRMGETNQPIPDTKPDTKHKEKINKKESELVTQDNPHQIPNELIQEWKSIRKKPVTKRTWDKTNKVMSELEGKGIRPIQAFEHMLEKQWQGMEVRYFNQELSTAKPAQTKGRFESSKTRPFLNKGIV